MAYDRNDFVIFYGGRQLGLSTRLIPNAFPKWHHSLSETHAFYYAAAYYVWKNNLLSNQIEPKMWQNNL